MSRAYAEVIGDPIAQSKSPIIHNFWLTALGIDAEYKKTLVKHDALADFIRHRREDAAWRGCNVTIPHKLAVMEHVADPGDVRETIGAMNTIVRGDDGVPFGTNTDAGGFYLPLLGHDLAGRPVTVIGTGGAANAILFALARAGVGSVTLLARNRLKAMRLLARFGLPGQALAMDAPLPAAALVVNASPLGMTGQPPLDIDLSPLAADAVVYDIVYEPLATPLLRQAAARGLATIDGLSMLVAQAALAFELFFGAPPPEGRDDELRELLSR